MRTLAKFIGYGLIILLVAAAIGFTYKYTNGFNEDFKTFYVEYGGKQILTTESKLTLTKGEKHSFGIKYTFDKEDAEPKGYKVKIVPNMTRDFDYTVDGEKYLFSKVGDLTAAFEPIIHDTFFELYLSESISFSELLKKAHNGNSVSVPSDALANNPYPFCLKISAYNDKVTYNIDFFVDSMEVGQTNGGNTTPPIIPDNPTVPDEPTRQSYAISWRFIGNEENLLTAEVVSPETAVAEETVQFAVSLIGDYKSEVTKIEVYSGDKLITDIEVSGDSGSSNYYNTFTFTMPEGDVEIVITIKPIDVSEYRRISYDTLGSGSVGSVMVYCSETAKPGDYVMVSISVDYGYEITRVVLQDADTGEDIAEMEQFNEFFDFTMPDCDVVILIYLAAI